MKKSTLIIFAMFAMVTLQAQNYLISFTGSGDTNVVTTVRVENLTSGSVLTLNGGDILHLVPIVGIDTRYQAPGRMSIYPNPMIDQAILTFEANEAGMALISITDIAGKPIYNGSVMVSKGEQGFRITGIGKGLYFVKVTGSNYSSSAKLMSLNVTQGEVFVEHVFTGQVPANTKLKSMTSTIEMLYTIGDQLIYTSASGRYSTLVPDVPTSSKTTDFNFRLCQDNEGHNYPVVMIATQTWMAVNLNMGTRVDGLQNQTNNGIIEKYCYSDSETDCDVYGGLYQWDEMMQFVSVEGSRGICPAGWHLPTDAEWTTLTDNLGGTNVAGGKLKETGTLEAGTGLWWSPNAGAVNNSAFTALPGGYRNYAGVFLDLSSLASFWSSSQQTASSIWARDLNRNNEQVSRYSTVPTDGFSVRCIRN